MVLGGRGCFLSARYPSKRDHPGCGVILLTVFSGLLATWVRPPPTPPPSEDRVLNGPASGLVSNL